MALGQRLRSAREEKGLRAFQLEEIIGSKGGTVSRWESGARRPRSEYVRRLAAALGVRMEWLLTGEEPRTQSGPELAPVLLGGSALDHVLATYLYPSDLSTQSVDAVESIVRGEVPTHPDRSPAAWRHRLDALCADRLVDSQRRKKAR